MEGSLNASQPRDACRGGGRVTVPPEPMAPLPGRLLAASLPSNSPRAGWAWLIPANREVWPAFRTVSVVSGRNRLIDWAIGGGNAWSNRYA